MKGVKEEEDETTSETNEAVEKSFKETMEKSTE